MFLDEKLYLATIDWKIGSPNDFSNLVNHLFHICDEHRNEQLPVLLGKTYQEVTALMDRIFNGWDLFIKRLEKEDWFLVDILKKYSYKNEYLKHDRLKQLYLKGK